MRARYHCTLDDVPPDRTNESVLNEYRPPKGSHLLMLTGELAAANLTRMMEAIDPQGFSYEIRVMPYAVIAWMVCEDVPDKIGNLDGIDVVMIPGRCAGDAEELQEALGLPVVRGPNCYSELGTFLEEHGFIRDTSDPPRPKVIVHDRVIAKFLAETYEVPLIDIDIEIKREIASGSKLGQGLASEIKHNQVAELVRGRLSLPDAIPGWIMINYPKVIRDTEWLEEMGQVPDAFIATRGRSSDPVVEFYRDDPVFLEIDSSLPDRQKQEQALVKVEARMQACVAKV